MSAEGSAGELTVRRLQADDAEALCACFQRCYGDTYAVDVFYDPPRLAAMIRRGELRSVVALAADGMLVGHTGLTVRHPEAHITEAGNTVVDPASRGHGVLGRMGAALAELCRTEGFGGYVHYPTTAHEVMQKRSVQNGGVETGLMLAHVPAETEYRNFDQAGGRLAVTVVFQPFEALPPRDVTAPDSYVNLLTRLYARAGLERKINVDGRTVSGPAQIRVHLQQRRGLLHIDVLRPGSDLSSQVAAAMAQQPAAVTHADLALGGDGVGMATEQLRALGFVYSGLLPESGATDILRMQHIAQPDATTFAPALVNDDARELLELIRAEYYARKKGTPKKGT